MISRIREQYQLFCLALSFFSRLPIPSSTPYSEERMNRAGRYFALVGALLGLLCALVFGWLSLFLPGNIAVLLTMVFSLLLTGAFHEDGLTDMADGIGGGMTHERRLAIMKDSRIGTYGAVTLAMVLLAKYALLTALVAHTSLLMVWVLAYTLSRTVAASLIYDMDYVSDRETSKSKPLASKQTKGELRFLILCGVLPCLWFSPVVALSLILSVVALRFSFKSWLIKRIGGFTGDCLGAAQQLTELWIYLLLVAFAHNGWLIEAGLV